MTKLNKQHEVSLPVGSSWGAGSKSELGVNKLGLRKSLSPPTAPFSMQRSPNSLHPPPLWGRVCNCKG